MYAVSNGVNYVIAEVFNPTMIVYAATMLSRGLISSLRI